MSTAGRIGYDPAGRARTIGAFAFLFVALGALFMANLCIGGVAVPLSELPGAWNQTEIFDTPRQNL